MRVRVRARARVRVCFLHSSLRWSYHSMPCHAMPDIEYAYGQVYACPCNSGRFETDCGEVQTAVENPHGGGGGGGENPTSIAPHEILQRDCEAPSTRVRFIYTHYVLIHTHTGHIRVCVCFYIYIYIHTYISTYLHTYIRTYIHTYLYTHAHTSRWVNTCCMCVCVRVCMGTYTHNIFRSPSAVDIRGLRGDASEGLGASSSPVSDRD